MKKLFMLTVALIFSASCFSQKVDEADVPDAVKSTFKVRFPAAASTAWEKEDTVYSASFLMDQAATEAEFTEKGVWMETEWEIPVQYTPKKIKSYTDSAFAGYKIAEIEIMDYPADGKLYKLEISKKKECQELYFTLAGDFKKSEKAVCDKKEKCCKKKKSCKSKK
jgi:hypothetical protein